MRFKKTIPDPGAPGWEVHIIRGCRKNDRTCQEALYRHFFPVMERMVLKYTRDEDKLFDIINDGFLKVFQKIDTYKGEGSFEGWIRRIVFNSLSNYFRKHSRDLKFLLFDNVAKVPSVKPESNLYYDDLMALVKGLPDVQMQVFHLHAIEGYTHREISQRLNINENTSKWHLAEARKELRSRVSRLLSIEYYGTG